ncbi:MAG: hypothetical protein IPL20_06695 [Saprospiraceae bacterium]|nr:hypothetical protein [Saprospiraceae bacterium]
MNNFMKTITKALVRISWVMYQYCNCICSHLEDLRNMWITYNILPECSKYPNILFVVITYNLPFPKV